LAIIVELSKIGPFTPQAEIEIITSNIVTRYKREFLILV